MSRRKGSVLVGLVLFIGCTSLQGVALADTVTCGDVITEDTTLQSDLGPCEGNALSIGADNITLDLGGHTVFGSSSSSTLDLSSHFLASDLVGRHSGIVVSGHHGVRIRNGTVTGFGIGVFVDSSDNVTLERLAVHQNQCDGIRLVGIWVFDTARGSLHDNSVTRNGCAGVTLGGRVTLTVVERNLIAENATAGLRLQSSGPNNSARINTARGNAIYRNGADGIAVTPWSLFSNIARNAIYANGGNGVRMEMGTVTTVEGNQIMSNVRNGVLAEVGATVEVRNNIATGNGTASVTAPAYDLADRIPGCSGNTWVANQFTTRNQQCIT